MKCKDLCDGIIIFNLFGLKKLSIRKVFQIYIFLNSVILFPMKIHFFCLVVVFPLNQLLGDVEV